MSNGKQTLRKSVDHYHNSGHEAFREVRPKSYYPGGRKKGADFAATKEFQEGWERVFGKKEALASDDNI